MKNEVTDIPLKQTSVFTITYDTLTAQADSFCFATYPTWRSFGWAPATQQSSPWQAIQQ